MKTIITRIKRLALALCFVTPLVSWAAEPIAVWDGDFSAEALNKFSSAGITLVDWQQTHGENNSSVTIDRANQGLMIQSTKAMPGITVLARYSNLAKGTKRRVIADSCVSSNNQGSRTGIQLLSAGTLKGVWGTDEYGTASGSIAASGVLAFVYSTAGTYLYYGATTDAISSTASWGSASLKSSNDASIYGAAIGGFVAGSSASGCEAAQGMKIEALAVFNKVLTNAEMTSYLWPSEIETIPVTGDTSFSALNALVAASEAKSVVLSLDDGATVMVDEAFAAASVPVVIASEGSIRLSAESQPDASYFTNADFSGVKGGLLRSWLTPGVVGFNFRNNSGGDTSGALATGTWCNDGGNVANGTSTAMFADGLSTLTWASANTWASGSGSILSGYLDDGSKNGNGAEVTLTNVPYEEYDVIIYCNSDSNPGSFFGKTVNGVGYTWDSENGAAVAGSVSTSWGKAALAIPVYGVNAIRIKNLTGPLTIYGTPRYFGGDSGSTRGGIAAIQIMPPDTPDNIRTYTLTLDGTATTWSAGTWTLEGNTVDAPTAGNVKIVASASTTVTVDSAVSIATLTVENSTDAVVSLVPGENGSISTINATVKSGVLKQGAANLVVGTLTVEDGGTFDFGGFASQANVRIAGDGDGNYPWALTSTGDAPLGNWISLVLDADATVGGTGKITFGKSNTAGYINYNGHTLTKTGTGELVLTNGRTATDGTGTLDIVGGKVTTSEYTCIDGFETIYAHTAVIVRNGAELSNGTNRRVWIDTLTVEDGATVTTASDKSFGITTALVTEGALTTTKLQFNDDATVTLGGDLTLTDFVAKGDDEHATVGDVALVLADGTASATVTVSGTVDAVGTVSVGSGITPVFSGTSDVTATLSYAADPSPTASAALDFTQQSNWKGTVVLDYAITGASSGTLFQPGKYGNANSTVCLGQGASNIFFGIRDSSNPGNVDTKLYFKGNVSLKNGWGGTDQPTTFPQLGADEGVTFTTRPDTGPNKKTYFVVTALKDFAGTIVVSTQSELKIENVVLDAMPANGALVVKATQEGTGVISGSVTVGDETATLVYKTVDNVSGLYIPTTVDITIPEVANATVAVTVGGVAVTPENGVVTVEVGSAVVVTYAAAEGYTLTGGTIEFTADANTTTVDTTSVKVSEYIAWIYDENGDLVGNPYTAVLNAVQTFLTSATGNSLRFKTSIEESYADFHTMLVSVCDYDGETFTYTRKPSVAKVTSGVQEYLYTTLIDAVTNAMSGATVTLLADVTVANMIDVDNAITLDLAGHTVSVGTWANAQYEDALFCVKYGGSLTVNDSSDPSTGAIDATGNPSKVYAAIKMTRTGETEGEDKVATLVVNGGAISGYYYAVTGNGTRGGTEITINGGTLRGTCEGDNLAIFHPQSGTLTLNGGTLTGVTGVEMRSGTLVVPATSTVAITATGAFSATPNGSGSTVTGAAIALSQHTTNKPLVATIAGGTFTATDTDGKAFYEVDLQDENTDGISATLAGGTFTGAVETENVETLIPATSTARFSDAEADGVPAGYELVLVEGSDPEVYEVSPIAAIQYYNSWSVPNVFYFEDEDPIPSRTTQGTVPTIRRVGETSYHAAEDWVVKTWTVTASDATDASAAASTIATVDENGLVTFTAPGTVKVWLTMTDPSGATKSASKTVSYKLAPAVVVSANGETRTAYATLLAAFNHAQTDETVVLSADATVSSNISKMELKDGRSITLDLNGHTVTFSVNYGTNTGSLFNIKSGSLAVVDTGATKGGIAATGTGGRVFSMETADNATTTLTIGEGVNISSAHEVCVYLQGAATLTTAGNLTAASDFAIAGNGTSGNGGTTVNVTGGTVTGDEIAIYQPQNGALNISGGTITGGTAVYVKSGSVTVTGGTLAGTGAKADYAYNGNGANATGDALVIDNCGYPGGVPAVSITGGTFTSANASAIASYSGSGYSRITKFAAASLKTSSITEAVASSADVFDDYVDIIPVTPGAQTEPVDTQADAEAEATKVVPSVPAAVAAELTTTEQQNAYKALFEAKVVTVTDGETTKYAVEVALKDTVVTEIQAAVDAEAGDLAAAAVAAAADATNGGEATVTTTPGLYYVVEAGANIGSIEPASCTLATGAETTLPVPNKGTSGFYKIRVSVTPVDIPVTTTVEP